MISAHEEFRGFIGRCGFDPPTRIEPGRFHRFPTNGKRGDDAGYAKLFPDGEGGIVGNFRTGEMHTWQTKRGRPWTDAEQRAWRERVERERRAAEEMRGREEKDAARRAAEIWGKAQAAPEDHPYLRAKGVKAHGLRLYRGPLAISGMRCDGALVVPVRNTAGEIQTLEFIAPDGEKRFLPRGRKAGGCYIIGEPRDTISIAEGFASGASVYETTDYAAVVAFDAANLEPVAKALREKHPQAVIVITGDNDASGTGQRAAEAAARAVGGLVAIPEVADTDWNDVHREHGAEAVQRAVASARAPDIPNAQTNVVRAPAATTSTGTGPVRVELISGADVRPEPIEWLWNGWLAAGKLHIIAGAPEAGKTSIALALAATLTVGGRWPDGSRATPGNVVIWSGEDSIDDTLVPRLIALGADMQRVRFVGRVSDADYMRPFDPAQDMVALRDKIDGSGAKLLLVDPIVSAVAGDSHENAKVRRSLQPVVDLAEAVGCAVLGVSHFSKGTAGRDPVERVTGSVAFGALPRLIFAAAKLPEEEGGGRIFVRAKNNLGPSGGGFGYSLEAREIAAGIVTSRLLWGGALDGNARTLLAQIEVVDGGDHGAIAEAKEFLGGLLADGPLPAKEIERDANGAGFAWRTVQEAARRLGVERRKVGMAGGWQWALPKMHNMPKMHEGAKPETLHLRASSEELAPSGGGGSGAVEVEV